MESNFISLPSSISDCFNCTKQLCFFLYPGLADHTLPPDLLRLVQFVVRILNNVLNRHIFLQNDRTDSHRHFYVIRFRRFCVEFFTSPYDPLLDACGKIFLRGKRNTDELITTGSGRQMLHLDAAVKQLGRRADRKIALHMTETVIDLF